MSASTDLARRDFHSIRAIVLTIVLAASLLLRSNHLGHASIKGLDESLHAAVARNLMKHPLTPTLYDRPFLDYDYRNWQSNHVWLHKPIVPLWQIAASMKLLGINMLALRLPSVLLATAAVWLTYAIGVRLLDWRAALIAATLQAFNPAMTSLVQGYVFSDHIDIAFLFYVELAMYLLVRAIQSKRTYWYIAAGIAQGLAYLSKSYPALVITGVAGVACVVATARPRDLLLMVAATIATVAPWTIWCAIRFPHEFAWEQLQVFRHLGTDVEGWAAPWDRVIFDFLVRIYHVFYPAVLAAVVILVPRAWRERNVNLSLLFAWGLGVVIPLTIATSKTPTATLIGWPPLLLLLGEMIRRAIDRDPWCLGAWVGATVIGVVWPGHFALTGWGYPVPRRFAGVLRENIWVLAHLAIALLMASAVGVFIRGKKTRGRFAVALLVVGSLASCALLYLTIRTTYRITEKPNRDDPSFAELGDAVRSNLPPNAVLLLEPRQKCEQIMAMFYTDRSVYPVAPSTYLQVAQSVAGNGGVPWLVTSRRVDLPPAFDRPLDGLNVYAIPISPAPR